MRTSSTARPLRLLALAVAVGAGALTPLAITPTASAATPVTFAATPSSLGDVVGDTPCRTVSVPVTGIDAVGELSVSMTLTHAWVGDLDVTLTSPSGASAPVFGRPGLSVASQGNYGDSSDLGGTYVFRDKASGTLGEAAAAAPGGNDVIAPGGYRATTFETGSTGPSVVSLDSVFAATDPVGTWTLSLCDRFSEQDPGEITAASLTITPSPDAVAPAARIDSGPADGARVGERPEYAFSSPDTDVASFECRTDALAWESCTSPYTPQLLGDGDGTHTVSVRAIDTSDNTGQAVSRTFVLDTLGPDVTINGGPADGATVAGQPSYAFFTNAADLAGYQCAVDGASFSPCTSPTTTDTAPGTHTFGVRATDDLGNIGPVTSRSFTLRDVACEDARADLTRAKAKLVTAKKALKKALASGNQAAIERARAKVKAAKKAVRSAQADVAEEC